MTDQIPVAGPSITQLEIDYVASAAKNAWYGRAGEWVERFETEFSAYIGVRHAVSMPSCTSAIHLSLLALGVGPGDEVVVPDATWIASAAPIDYVGAFPVFVDVDPVSWCLDPAAFEAAITPRTRAVIPVDLYGGMPDMRAVRQIATTRDIAVIEDAAEAVGSWSEDGMAGSHGDTGVFSFHGSKTLTTGEGGMLVTDRDDVASRVRVLADHGREPSDVMFQNKEVAFKYKMSSLQAAMGCAQLERIDELLNLKRTIFGWYQEELGGDSRLALNAEMEGSFNSYWMVTVILDVSLGLRKEPVIRSLARQGIATRPFFYPLSSLEAYATTPSVVGARSRNPVSYRLGESGLNLPSALSLTREDVARTCSALRSLLPGH